MCPARHELKILKQRHVCACRQRRNLARTLRDNDDVIRTLEVLTGIMMHMLALVAYAAIFGVDVGHLLISLSSISVASAFVFGNSLRTIFESVVFLFVIRPYQVLPPPKERAQL